MANSTRPDNLDSSTGPQSRRESRARSIGRGVFKVGVGLGAHELGKRLAGSDFGRNTGVRLEHSPTKEPPDEKKKKLSPEELKAAEVSSKEPGLYNNGAGDEPPPETKKKRRLRLLGWRKKTSIAIAGGVVTVTFFGFLTFTPQFKVPSIIGDIRINLPSGLIMRYMAESAGKRLLANYLISKAKGDLDSQAKPGSMRRGLHDAFDKANVAGIAEGHNGIEMRKIGGDVYLFHNGKKIGLANNYKQLKTTLKGSKLSSKAFNGLVTHTIPFARFLDIPFMRLVKGQFIDRYGTEKYNKERSEAQNLADNEKREAEAILRGPTEKIGDAIACAGGIKTESGGDPCKTFDDTERKQPFDTSDPSLRQRLTSPGEKIDNVSIQAVDDEIQAGFNDTLAEEAPQPGTFMQRMVERIATRLLGAATSKLLTGALPLIGPIDALAQIQHYIGVAISQQLFLKTSTLVKQEAYGAVGGLWLGYADQIKDGNMHFSFAVEYGERLTGFELSAMSKLLSGEDPRAGFPVAPKIGSDLDDPLGDAMDFVYGGNFINRDNILESPKDWGIAHIIRFPLELWYESISQLLGKFGEVVGALTSFITEPATTLMGEVMAKIFGPDWFEELGLFAIQTIMHLLGNDIDPGATGAPLANNIITGIDVLNNTYIQRNLGGKEMTSRQDFPYLLQEANQNYRDSVAALPLRDRLFSLDLPSSLSSKLVMAAPDSAEPSVLFARIIKPIKALPSTFMTLVSGRSWAAVTSQQVTNVNGQVGFGGTVNEIEESDIPVEVNEQANPVCPPNADGFFNNCQRYKEVIKGAMCMYTDCPELKD